MPIDDPTSDSSRIPIITLWNRILVPLQGDITDRQAARLSEDVLTTIQRTGAVGMVVDLSGLLIVDSHLCSVLAQLSSSARFMGTRMVISGLNADIALTLQTMGVELRGIETALGLEQGLELLGVALADSRSERARREEFSRLVEQMLGNTNAVPAASPAATGSASPHQPPTTFDFFLSPEAK